MGADPVTAEGVTSERTFVKNVDRPEWCRECGRHIRHHFGGVEYRCDPRADDPGDRSVREQRLRSSLRASVAYYLQEELDGGELYKETWEECEDDRDRDVVRSELRALLALVGATR